mgnify:CR=1 FL=1
MDALYYMSIIFREPWLIALVAAGTCAGVYVGAIPGLSGTMAVSLLVSFTFGWEQHMALAVMVGVYVGSVFGGSRSAILLNIPGAPAAVATALDGYALAKQGRAGEAMGLATSQSVIGTLLGVLALATCAPLVASIARNFHSIDYLMLSLMGLMMVGSLSGRSVRFGLIAGCIGIFLGCVGVDGQTAVKRFTFNIVYLNSGVDYVVAMIGLFGASEALSQITDMKATPVKQKVDKILPSWVESMKYLGRTIKSSIIGVLVGALPGAGGDIAALLSYDQAKRSVKNPSAPFGKGAVEGIIAPESANNAAIGGAFIPMLTLAVPIFDTLMAMLRRALKHESIMHADKGHLHHHLMAAGFGQRRSVLIMYGIVGIMGEVAILISRELYKDAVPLFMIAVLYMCIIMVPKKTKKGIKRIITQDTSELEKEYFTEYLNYERERRKELREAAKAAAAAAADDEEDTAADE